MTEFTTRGFAIKTGERINNNYSALKPEECRPPKSRHKVVPLSSSAQNTALPHQRSSQPSPHSR